MELLKYPLDKLLIFLASVIPGAVALLVFHSASPNAFDWFVRLDLLGYKTKCGLVLLACFLAGYSITTLLGRVLGAIGGGVGGYIVARLPTRPDPTRVAPWRDPTWRALVESQLGSNAPKNTTLLTDVLYKIRCDIAENLPQFERPQAIMALNQEKLMLEGDDLDWQRWYDHYHQIVLNPPDRDFAWHIANGLNFNLQAAGVYTLVSAAIVPALRHWWCIVPAAVWSTLLVFESYYITKQAIDPWSTFSAQLIYLNKLARREAVPGT